MLALAPLALFTLAAVARAQSVSTDDIPSACATDCSSTCVSLQPSLPLPHQQQLTRLTMPVSSIEVSTLCSAQYSDSTDLAACFCSGQSLPPPRCPPAPSSTRLSSLASRPATGHTNLTRR